MAFYIFKSGICLAIFYGFYKLLLEKESFHIFKRFYLLVSAVLAFVIPLITFTEYIDVIPQETPLFFPEFTVINNIIENEPINYTPYILWSIYCLGVLLFSFKFFKNLIELIIKVRRNPKFKNHSFINVLLQDLVIPHTFFNYIFLNKQKFETQQIPKEVLLHEETHAKQKHSLDVLFIEILQILFWFNPFIYFIKRSIKLNHEFLADQAVLNKGTKPSTYQQILLAFSSNATEPTLSNAINYSSIKKRFTVMKTKTSKQAIWLRSLILLPLLAILIYSFSEKKIVEKETNEPFKIQQNIERNGVPEAMMKEYRDFILNTERTNIIVYPKYIRAVAIYDLMTDEQRNSVKKYPKNLIPNLSDVKPKTPTEEVFNSWKDSNEFAIWIDGKHVKNSELDNYKVSDIKYFTTSFVYNNARSNKFPQPYQNNLYTQKGFETTFTNAKKDNSALEQIKKELEINSNLNKPEPVLEISFNPDIFRLNGKDTSLKQLKEDFIAVINNEKSDLNIKTKGGINMSLINKIMAELKGNLIKIHLDEETYIIEDGFVLEETTKATPEEVEEYNKLAKQYNSQPENSREIKLKDLKRLEYIYNKMTKKQKANAEAFPNCPPPPPPPPSPLEPKNPSKELLEAKKEFNEKASTYSEAMQQYFKEKKGNLNDLKTQHKEVLQLYNIYEKLATKETVLPPPPPPAPKSPLDHIIDMAKKGAEFYYEGKSISSDDAIDLLKKNDKLNISTQSINEKITVKIQSKPITH
jgi:hypothetical protein